MMNKLIIFTCLAIIPTLGSIASAIPQWRDDPGSAYQEWGFGSNELVSVPDIVSNPHGTPFLKVTTYLGDWIPDPGAWALGEIDVQIPNSLTPNPEKWIQIQLTWQPVNNDSLLPSEPIIGIVAYPLFEGIYMGPRTDTYPIVGWIQSTFDITIWPNPSVEWIAIKGDILVDELIIDTICIPEPATICLFGLGMLTLLRKRRV